MSHRVDKEVALSVAFLVAAALSWWVFDSLTLSIVGALGGLTSATLYIWQRWCLTGVTYRRSLSATRAEFGEEVVLVLEVVNDKLLPVTWLHIEDDVSPGLRLLGATVITDSFPRARLVNVMAVLPFQRVRRRIRVVCRERGPHTFGPASLRSGDPIGLRTRWGRSTERQHLLVFPKRFALTPPNLASRVVIGDFASRRAMIEDPSRVVGVREYRRGDPLRSIDWRATARSTGLLVREFEPTVTPRVAVFVDFRAPFVYPPDNSRLEFAIAVAASLLTELEGRGVAVGLFGSASVDGEPLSFPPSDAPNQLPLLLEGLARCPAEAAVPFEAVLTEQSGRLRSGASVVIVASDYREETLAAIPEMRRRHAVTAVWVRGEDGAAPARDQVDALLQVDHTDDWRDAEVLELAA